MAMDFEGKKAFITGGSSGIGLALAKQLAREGAHVFIAARGKENLVQAYHTILSERKERSQCIGFVEMDVSNPDQVWAVARQWQAEQGAPDLLINCAGVAHPGYFEQLDIEKFHWMINVNYLGAVYVTKAFIDGMISRQSGHIVNICSGGGYVGLFGYTAYSGSKFALRGFSDALRMEMKIKGVGVSIAFPPDTDTPQLAYENKFKPFETKYIVGSNSNVANTETVANSIIRGVKRGKYQIFPTLDVKFWYTASRLLGSLTYKVADMMVQSALKAKKKYNGSEPKA